MKSCPACKRNYADDSLRFCLDDGTVLVSSTPQPQDSQPTLRMPDPIDAGRAPTKVMYPRQTLKAQPPGPTLPAMGMVHPSPARRRLWPILGGVAMIALGVLFIITVWWVGARAGDELLYQTRFDHTTKMQLLLLIGVNV